MPDVIETTDAAATGATTYSLRPGEWAQGTLSSNSDRDGYHVTLTAGQTYTFALVGVGVQGVQDTFLRVLNAAGTVLQQDDDSGNGPSSYIVFTPTTSGVYTLVAGSYNDTDHGTYGLSVDQGSIAHFGPEMGAGAIQVAYATWGGGRGQAANVTWSARSTNPGQQDANEAATPFIRASAQQIAAFEKALAMMSDVSGVTFTRVAPGGYSDNATIRLGAYNHADGSAAYAYLPGNAATTAINGDLSINNENTSTTSLPQGSYDFLTVLHELGHAVGLSHPGDYNAQEGVSITFANSAQFLEDTNQYSVMSYFDESEAPGGVNIPSYPDTLMMYDILAMQNLYGANMATRSGDSVYGFGANTGSTYDFAINTDPYLCIWDGGGIDTLNASGYAQAQTIDLRAGHFSNIGGRTNNVSIAIGAMIENATGGAGADRLIGNDAANILNGGGGADIMIGGKGNDIYYIDNVNDQVIEAKETGIDLVNSTVSYDLSGQYIEDLTLTGSAAINGIGNSLANTIVGNSSANRLDGGKGADTLAGGAGNDTYYVDNVGDRVIEAKGAGTDLIYSTVSYDLSGQYIEKLTLTGSAAINATGNSLDNTIIGNDAANIIDGGKGNDRIRGDGGADVLTGGSGADAFVYDRISDSTLSAYDRITDLTAGDTIDLSDIDANTLVAGNQAFAIVDGFSHTAGQMTLEYSSTTKLTTILMDVNGDGVADMKIVVNGDHHDFSGFDL